MHGDATMLESPPCFDSALRRTERRIDPRRQVSSIIYVQLGEDNGGVILNVGEGGLAVQAALALTVENLPPLRFQLSVNKWVQASAQIAWLTQSKRTAGLRFQGLSENARSEIREWLALEEGDFPFKNSREDKNLSRLEAVPQNVIPPTESDLTLESQQDSTPLQPEVPLPNSKAALSSATGLSGSRRHDERPEKQRARESVPPERQHFGASGDAHALSGRVIAAKLRRYLVDERHRIRLYELVSKETESLCAHLTETNFPASVPVTVEEFLTRIHRYEELSEKLLSIIATGCFWGDSNLEPIWPKIVERVAATGATNTGKSHWVSLRFYPALLLLYTGGLAQLARGNYSALASLLLQPKLNAQDGNYSLIEQVYASSVIGDEQFRTALCGAAEYELPVSAYLYVSLRERLREFIPSDKEYSGLFDRFEYLLALVWTDLKPESTRVDWIPVGGPLGLFASKAMGRGEPSIIDQIYLELSDLGKSYPLLRSGLFGGSPGRLRSASQRVAAQIELIQQDALRQRDASAASGYGK